VQRRRLRTQYLNWGASDSEVEMALVGDAIVAHADVAATRAITVDAQADAVWPWIAQLGQGRGGFYSYERLENLVGCGIHNAARVHPEWQSVEVGDEVKLHPQVPMRVELVTAGRALILRGGVPMGRVSAPYDFTWAFVLRDRPGGGTRLLVRERYGYSRPWASLVVEPTQLVSFVMSRKMMRGIKSRAEQAVS
jgi:hypothetical protein